MNPLQLFRVLSVCSTMYSPALYAVSSSHFVFLRFPSPFPKCMETTSLSLGSSYQKQILKTLSAVYWVTVGLTSCLSCLSGMIAFCCHISDILKIIVLHILSRFLVVSAEELTESDIPFGVTVTHAHS